MRGVHRFLPTFQNKLSILVIIFLCTLNLPTFLVYRVSVNVYFLLYLIIIICLIRCTSRFKAGSRINETNFVFCFLFLAPVGGFYHAGPYPNNFPNLAGQSKALLSLTCHKIIINFIIFNNPYKQHFTRKCTRSNFLKVQ